MSGAKRATASAMRSQHLTMRLSTELIEELEARANGREITEVIREILARALKRPDLAVARRGRPPADARRTEFLTGIRPN